MMYPNSLSTVRFIDSALSLAVPHHPLTMRNRRHSSHLLALSTADAAPRPRRTFLYPLPYFPLSQIPRMPSASRLRSCSHSWLPARALDETIKLQLCCQELFFAFCSFFCSTAKLPAQAGNALGAKKKILKTSSNVNSKIIKTMIMHVFPARCVLSCRH